MRIAKADEELTARKFSWVSAATPQNIWNSTGRDREVSTRSQPAIAGISCYSCCQQGTNNGQFVLRKNPQVFSQINSC